MIELTEQILLKHKDQVAPLLEVKAHARRSKKGKAYQVKQFERKRGIVGRDKSGKAIYQTGGFTTPKKKKGKSDAKKNRLWANRDPWRPPPARGY